jgi:hypothetical protein
MLIIYSKSVSVSKDFFSIFVLSEKFISSIEGLLLLVENEGDVSCIGTHGEEAVCVLDVCGVSGGGVFVVHVFSIVELNLVARIT